MHSRSCCPAVGADGSISIAAASVGVGACVVDREAWASHGVSAMTLSPGPRAQPAHHPHQQPQHATPTPTRRVLPDIISVVRAGQQGAIISRPATPQRHLPLPPPRQEQPPPTPPSARNGVASPAALSPLPAPLPSSRKAPPAEEELLKPPLGWETPLEEESGEGWGEDGRVGGGDLGEEEHRFCCTVARMRLVIHLQTMLRGTGADGGEGGPSAGCQKGLRRRLEGI